MSRYIRPKTANAMVFFTVVAYQRRHIFCQPDFLQAFRPSIKQVQQKYPFIIHGWVQLPDHLHCIWEMPCNDGDYGKRWGQIKLLTTRACPQYHMPVEQMAISKQKRHEKGIWQRRFFEHHIRDDDDMQRHMDYLHYNPVKHGYVKNVADWQYSSFHRLVRKGIYSPDWGANDEIINYDGKEFGE